MGAEATRVPTPERRGWSVETVLDHILALINEADKRYQQRFEASEKALDLGFSSQKDAISAAFAAQKDAINAALASADRAVTKAELATEKRFESVNEFRGTLDQQQRTLIPRSEVAVIKDGIDEKITQLTKQVDEMRASQAANQFERRGVRDGWGYAVGVVGLVIGAVGLIGTIIALVSKFAVK